MLPHGRCELHPASIQLPAYLYAKENGTGLYIRRNLMSDSTSKAIQDSWLIQIGNRFNSQHRQLFSRATAIAYFAPPLIWLCIAMALRTLGERLNASLLYLLIFVPAFAMPLFCAIARKMSDKLFGDFYQREKLGSEYKTITERYLEAINKQDYRIARQIVIYQVLNAFCMFLLGSLTGAAMFYMFFY